MPPESDNPFSLDAAVAAKLFDLPEQDSDAHSIEAIFNANRELQPQAWEIQDYHDSKPATAIDRELESISDVANPMHLSDLTITGTHEVLTRIGPISFNGSALLCKCPDCAAPMTIRLWLGLADCWRCPASVALDERIVAQISTAVKEKRRELPKPPPSPEDFFSRRPLETLAPQRFQTSLIDSRRDPDWLGSFVGCFESRRRGWSVFYCI